MARTSSRTWIMTFDYGTNANDVLYGDDNYADVMYGYRGNDTFFGSLGPDRFYGGADMDTVDYRYSGSAVTVDLNIGRGRGGDAEGDWYFSIENVRGSNFSDRLNGNSFDNVIKGGNGNDYIDGGAGNDSLYGEYGNDTFFGSTGSDDFFGGPDMDTVNYRYSNSGVDVDLVGGVGTEGNADGDYYNSIENIRGSGFRDQLRGNGIDNILKGGDGDDILSGSAGDDGLYGENGNDKLEGGTGADYLNGGAGLDSAFYFNSRYGVKVNLATGEASGFDGTVETALGDAAGDTLIDIEGIMGSQFSDHLTGDEQSNSIVGSLGDDIVFGGAGADDLWGDEGDDELHGGSGADDLDGHDGNDVLYGDAGRDQLEGDSGDDVLYGGTGDDDLIGGNGEDIFVFEQDVDGNNTVAMGNDTIWDFEIGIDRIDLDDTDVRRFSEIDDNDGDFYMVQAGDDTVIHLYDEVITLRDIDKDDLSSSDFIF